ncbi:MAG: DUF2905 family protein [Bacteroidetes bacterium]|jgi:uncharacterized membrane protein YhhN|nr:DUF2905 family protein [Bacteroidota bacterium]
MADEPLLSLGRLLLVAGLALALLGGALLLAGRLPGLGDLPGDFRWETERGTSVYMPLGTMIIVSLVLTILLNVALWLWRG